MFEFDAARSGQSYHAAQLEDVSLKDCLAAGDFAAQSLALCRHMFYLAAQSVDPELWDYVADEVVYIGSLQGQDGVQGRSNYRETLKIYQKTSFAILGPHYYVLHSTDKCAVICGEHVLQSKGGALQMTVPQRFTMFFIPRAGRPCLLHAHVSEPDVLKQDGEDFPYLMGRELKEILINYRRSAEFDELTGLNNRNYLEAAYSDLDAELAAKGGLVCLYDLNGFKPVNDHLGHAAGDALLRLFAQTLQQAVQEAELAAADVLRIGGDEFLLIAAGAGSAEAVRLRAVVRRCFKRRVQTLYPEVSCAAGSAVKGEGQELPSLRELISTADLQMFKAKARIKDLGRR